MGLFVFLALLALQQQPPPRDVTPPPDRAAPSKGASVSGRVYSAVTGAPIRGAVVALAAKPLPETASARDRSEVAKSGVATDAAGRFRITGVAPGSYFVLVMPATFSGHYLPVGYNGTRANDAGRTITVADGAILRNVDVALASALAIEGRVVDDAGEPLSRVSVFVARYPPGSDAPQRVGLAVQTDDLGRYRVYGLERGTYLVAADGRSGLAFFEQSSDGRIISGSFVQRESEQFTTTFHPSALVDTAAQRVRLTTQDVTGVDITLQRTRRLELSATVLDSTGAPAPFTSVALIRRGLALPGSLPFRADAQGRIMRAALEPGEYRLLIGGGLWPGLGSVNGRTEFAEVALTMTSDLSGLVVMTQPGIGLAGQIAFAETPPATPPSMKIALRRPEDGVSANDELQATTDEHLRFYASDVFGPQLIRVTGLPDGWTVKAVTLAGTDITDVPTVFTRDHDGQLHVVLSSRASTVEGQVRSDGTGPPGQSTIYVFGEDRESWRISSPRTHTSEVPAGGRFSVGGLTAGRYYAIAIAREGFRPVPNAGAAFFELLSKEATPFDIGEGERKTLELRLWRWPE